MTSKADPELETTKDLDKVNLLRLRDGNTALLVDSLFIRDNSQFGLEPDSFKRANKVAIDDMTFSIPSVEDFIMMKLASRSAGTSDFQDLFTTMVNNYERIDWKYFVGRAKAYKIESLLENYKRLAAERRKKK